MAFALRCSALSLGLAVAAACSSGSLTLGRDAAIAAARAAVPERETITGVISAKTGQFSDFDNHATDVISPPNRKVGAVAFAGSFSGSCGPARPTADAHSTCPPPATTMLVIIDQRNAAELAAVRYSLVRQRAPELAQERDERCGLAGDEVAFAG